VASTDGGTHGTNGHRDCRCHREQRPASVTSNAGGVNARRRSRYHGGCDEPPGGHRAGRRRAAPFVDVNCAAIPETLLEAELFGWERGAFTDARQAKPGLFQAAQGGTIFLDEIGLMPMALQAKLLKVIEEQTVRRLGSTRGEALDV
jgi:hypothetical protein